jgi:hypothetical protein
MRLTLSAKPTVALAGYSYDVNENILSRNIQTSPHPRGTTIVFNKDFVALHGKLKKKKTRRLCSRVSHTIPLEL